MKKTLKKVLYALSTIFIVCGMLMIMPGPLFGGPNEKLSDLLVDGVSISGFNENTYVYNIELPFGTTTPPTVSAVAKKTDNLINYTQATSLPGTATVVSTNKDGNKPETYTVNFTVAADTSGGTSYTITASAGTGGTISPSGSVSVNSGNNQTFNISANPSYSISDVKVDGTSQGAITTYEFENVTDDHTIEAEFVHNGGGSGGGGATDIVPTGGACAGGSLFEGNFDVGNLTSGLSGFKIDYNPSLGDYPADNPVITITEKIGDYGIKWQVYDPSVTVYVVGMKGGTNANVYYYSSGATSGTNCTLINPNNNTNYGISHIVFGYTTVTPQTGSITVNKSGLVGSDVAIFTLTGPTGQVDPVVTVDNNDADATYPSSYTWGSLPFGSYTLTETYPATGNTYTYTNNLGTDPIVVDGAETVNVVNTQDTTTTTGGGTTTTTTTTTVLTVLGIQEEGQIEVLGIQDLPYTGQNTGLFVMGSLLILAGASIMAYLIMKRRKSIADKS